MKSIFFVSKLSRVQSLGLTDSKVPWTIRSSNQSTLKETNPEYSVEGLMLKLKFQHFGQLMWRADSLEKTLMLGKTEGRKRRGWQDEMVGWHHRLNGYEFEQILGVGDGQGNLACCSPWGRKELDTAEWLNWTNWTETWIVRHILPRTSDKSPASRYLNFSLVQSWEEKPVQPTPASYL